MHRAPYGLDSEKVESQHTFADIRRNKTWNTKNTPFTGVSPVFQLLKADDSLMVNLTTTQVETFFGELEYIEPRLKALGVTLADEGADRV